MTPIYQQLANTRTFLVLMVMPLLMSCDYKGHVETYQASVITYNACISTTPSEDECIQKKKEMEVARLEAIKNGVAGEKIEAALKIANIQQPIVHPQELFEDAVRKLYDKEHPVAEICLAKAKKELEDFVSREIVCPKSTGGSIPNEGACYENRGKAKVIKKWIEDDVERCRVVGGSFDLFSGDKPYPIEILRYVCEGTTNAKYSRRCVEYLKGK